MARLRWQTHRDRGDASRRVAEEDASGFQRFFGRGAWSPDSVGRVVLQMVLKLLAPAQRVELTLDDTLARHTGKHIASAGMHRNPLLSTGAKPYYHFGHNWVVLAAAVALPWGKTVSLPFLVRLDRSVKAAKAAQSSTSSARRWPPRCWPKSRNARRNGAFSSSPTTPTSIARSSASYPSVSTWSVAAGWTLRCTRRPPPYRGVGRP